MKASSPTNPLVSKRLYLSPLIVFFYLVVISYCFASGADKPAIGPTGVIVQSRFGGQIFGFDIDQASNEGILCEAHDVSGNKVLAAIETFDQTTGEIIRVIRRQRSQDD